MSRHNNNGLRKLCDCTRRNWPKCSHPWHFNYKPRGGKAYHFSLDAEVGKPIEGKTEAEKIAGDFRTAINNGTFVRAADRRKAATAAPAADAGAVTLDTFATTYVERQSEASGKATWENDKYMFAQVGRFVLAENGARLGDKAIGAITEDDLEAFHGHLRAIGRVASTRNQYVQLQRRHSGGRLKRATSRGRPSPRTPA